MKRITVIWVMAAMVAGGWLRWSDLDKTPPHLGNDEISIGYDSYSILKTGKDEHGISWPLSFKSHRTYKAPLYAYLNISQILVWGRTENGVRMTSALAGMAAIGVVGAIGTVMGGSGVGIASAWLMAANPKAIWASRIGLESNLAATVGLLAVWSLLVFFLTKRKIFYIISAVMFGMTIWGYHTWWGLGPMLAGFLPLMLEGLRSYRKWIVYWAIVIIVATPIAVDFIKVQLGDENNRANSQMWWQDSTMSDLLVRNDVGFGKKVAMFVTGPAAHYLDHFSLDGNFSNGLELFEGRSPMEQGWFLLPTLVLVIIGLIKGKTIFGKYFSPLIGWCLLCPIVPAMTYGGVSAFRNLAMVAPVIIVAGGGLVYLVRSKRRVAGVIILALGFSFWQFYLAYFVHYPKVIGNNFQYGYKQAWEKVKPMVDDYDRIIVEPKFGRHGQFVGVPHLYFGYFGAFEAQDMLMRIDRNGTKVGKYEFREVDWFAEPIIDGKSIYIVSAINAVAGEWFDKLDLVDQISTPDDQRQFLIYQSK